MGILLTILAAIAIIWGVFQLVEGAVLLGIVLVVVGLLLLGGFGYAGRGRW